MPECGRRFWVSEQNGTFTSAFRTSGRRLSVGEIRAEVHKHQKEMRDAAPARKMTEEVVALEKLKDRAEKEAARKAAMGQVARPESRARRHGRCQALAASD